MIDLDGYVVVAIEIEWAICSVSCASEVSLL